MLHPPLRHTRGIKSYSRPVTSWLHLFLYRPATAFLRNEGVSFHKTLQTTPHLITITKYVLRDFSSLTALSHSNEQITFAYMSYRAEVRRKGEQEGMFDSVPLSRSDAVGF